MSKITTSMYIYFSLLFGVFNVSACGTYYFLF